MENKGMAGMPSKESLKTEIENHLGFFPPHFQPLLATPALLEQAWKLWVSVYTVERIPLLFKEKAFAYLSQFTPSSYFLICQACRLKELGMNGEEIFIWLKKPPLTDLNIQDLRRILGENRKAIDAWPEKDSLLEKVLFESLTLLYHGKSDLRPLKTEVKRVLGSILYNDFLNLLIFIRTSHEWAEAFDPLQADLDERVKSFQTALLTEEPRLKEFFNNYSETCRSELSKLNPQILSNPSSTLHPDHIYVLNTKLRTELEETKRALTQIQLGKKSPLEGEESLELFKNIVETAPDIIYRLDPGGNFVYVNDTVHVLGFSPEELKGRHFSCILHEEDAQTSSREQVLPQLAGEKTGHQNAPKLFDERRTGERMTRDLEIRLLAKKGFPVRSSSYYFGEVNSCGFYTHASSDKKEFLGTIGIIRNTSDRKKIELTKDNFLSTVSHELRTPAAVIKEAVYSLQEGLAGPLTDEQMGFVKLAHRNADRLSKIINNILDLSRLESRKVNLFKKGMSLEKIIRETISNYAPVAKHKTLKFVMDEAHQPIKVDADEELLSVVLNNLLDNAIRFAKSEVIVRAAFLDADGVIVKDKTNTVLVSVMDDGPGIDPNYMKILFNKYTQINRPKNPAKYKGTGLGLVICKEIIDLHRGKIWVESYPAQGAHFHFTLPLSHETDLTESGI